MFRISLMKGVELYSMKNSKPNFKPTSQFFIIGDLLVPFPGNGRQKFKTMSLEMLGLTTILLINSHLQFSRD